MLVCVLRAGLTVSVTVVYRGHAQFEGSSRVQYAGLQEFQSHKDVDMLRKGKRLKNAY